MIGTFNPENGKDIFENMWEFISKIIENTRESLENLQLNTGILSELLGLKKASEKSGMEGNSKEHGDKHENHEHKDNKNENGETKEEAEDKLSLEKLKSFFERNATNLSVDVIDGKDFFEISYIDKNSGSKVKGIIPFRRNGDSNIYMPGDRSGINETMNKKNFKQNITDKNSKKARFIFEGDANKIKDGTQQSARYNNVIDNFESMISPMKLASSNPKINIIGHSRAGATVNKLIGKYSFISNYIILDGTYGTYNNVLQSLIPGKIFYTNHGGTTKYINNYKDKPYIEVIGDYSNLNHEQIVSQVLFNDSRTQDLFA